MENLLDILTTLVRLLYIWFKRSKQPSESWFSSSDNSAERVYVKRGVLIGRLCDWIELTTIGRDTDKDSFYGYLYSLWDSLGGDVVTLRQVCADNHYCAEVRAILLIAQMIRYVPGEVPKYDKPPQSQKDVLKRQAAMVAEGFSECGLDEPSRDEVQEALERYAMFSPGEIRQMVAAL